MTNIKPCAFEAERVVAIEASTPVLETRTEPLNQGQDVTFVADEVIFLKQWLP